jgi:hypothetical protein
MKLNRVLFFAAAAVMVVGGSTAVVAYNRADDGDQDNTVAMAEQAGSESADQAQDALGVEQYRGGARGGGFHGGGRGFGGRGYGGRGWGARGWGGRGYGRGWGPGYYGYCNPGSWYCW